MEKGISFSGSNVIAVFNGWKSQTRRPCKIPEGYRYIGRQSFFSKLAEMSGKRRFFEFTSNDDEKMINVTCPYAAGDVLWIRESFRPVSYDGSENRFTIEYKADGKMAVRTMDWPTERDEQCNTQFYKYMKRVDNADTRWIPPLFMPKWVARFAIEVVDVEIQRLGDITEEGAIHEGIERSLFGTFKNYLTGTCDLTSPINSYISLWKNIYGANSWDPNQWVFVCHFMTIPFWREKNNT